MPHAHAAALGFRGKIKERRHVLGTFIKIPTSHTTEIVGLAGFDFVIIDAEHAPFDRAAIDIACLAARAADIAAIVRVPEANAAHILNALDLGATGVMVPHCSTPEKPGRSPTPAATATAPAASAPPPAPAATAASAATNTSPSRTPSSPASP